MNIVYGNILAEKYYESIREEISECKGRCPKLVVVLVGEDPASQIYVASKEKACAKVGISAQTIAFASDIGEEELISCLENLNRDDEVDGILLQLPLPEGLESERILQHISPSKDVDGLTYENMGKLMSKDDTGLVSCTPLGVMALLQEMEVSFHGKRAVVIGRSKLVGMPLFHLLSARDCTVTLCHSRTENLQAICQEADILVSAVGKPHMITAEYVKEGAYVIDVGVSRVEGKIVGDIDFANVKEKAAAITPMPKGTGPMTIAMLIRNTFTAFKRRN